MELTNRKKTLLLSLIVLGVVALIGGPGIIAYFSDTETSGVNEFTAGTIDLAVNGDNPWTGVIDADLKDLKPCMNKVGTVTLSNVGTNPFDVWVKIIEVTTADGTETNPEAADPDSPANNIDTVIRYDLTVGTTDIITDADDYTISDGAHHLAGDTTGVKDKYIYLGNIAAGGTLDVTQSFMMDCDTTNWAQGDTMSFKVQFYALQSEGDTPPPVPTPELTGYGRP